MEFRRNKYDVIIIGGGPAGLQCAAELSGTELNVLLIEKEKQFGKKVCAGGLTIKDIAILPVPEDHIENMITEMGLYSRKRKNISKTRDPLVFIVNRLEFGEWHRNQVTGENIEIITGARVTDINEYSVIVNGKKEIGYRYLVGADGFNSLVRKYLGFPQRRKLIAIQYRVPKNEHEKNFEIHLNSRYFRSWYAWVFPHRDHYVIGCCCDPGMMSTVRLKKSFHRWLEEKNIDISNAAYESAPIAYDYRGLQFGNIFLVGDAGGFASGISGEGIYQSLVSGKAAALRILDPESEPEDFNEVLRYNRIQKRMMYFFYYAGPFRGLLYELVLILLNNKRFQRMINRLFL